LSIFIQLQSRCYIVLSFGVLMALHNWGWQKEELYRCTNLHHSGYSLELDLPSPLVEFAKISVRLLMIESEMQASPSLRLIAIVDEGRFPFCHGRGEDRCHKKYKDREDP
jgi:hypothetical protein